MAYRILTILFLLSPALLVASCGNSSTVEFRGSALGSSVGTELDTSSGQIHRTTDDGYKVDVTIAPRINKARRQTPSLYEVQFNIVGP